MAGTRLLIAGSFALPFALLTVLSFYHGIPGDDMLWKRLKALSWFGAAVAAHVPPFVPQHITTAMDDDESMMMRAALTAGRGGGVHEEKPLLVVPTSSSWVVNEWEQLLYEVIPLSEAEVESLCQQKGPQRAGSSLEHRATIVLCRGDAKVLARKNYIYLYSKSKQQFRNMLHSATADYPEPTAGSSVQRGLRRPRVVVQVVLDPKQHGPTNVRSDSSSWKEMVDHLVSGLSSQLGHDNPCCLDDDNVSLELKVLREDDDEPSLLGRLLATGGGTNIADVVAEFLATTTTTTKTKHTSSSGSNNDGNFNNNNNNNNNVILYMTSSEQVQAINQQLGAGAFRLAADAVGGGIYLYILAMDNNVDNNDDHHRSAILAAVQDGLQRIILHDCWNLPLDIVVANDDGGSDEEGLRTLYQVYNATLTRLMVHRLHETARWLQYRIDHLHSTASVTSRYRRSSSKSGNNNIDDHGGIQSAVRELLFRGRLDEARQLIDSIRFGMVPDFPYDQYAAIFAPLLFPLLLPVVLTTIREVKRYRQHHKTA